MQQKFDNNQLLRKMKSIRVILAGAVTAVLCSCNCSPKFNLDENIGICTKPGNYAAAAAAGLSYVEVGVAAFLIPESSDEEFAVNREIAKASPIELYSANGFYPKEIRLVGPEAETERAVVYAKTAIKRASELGLKVLVLGSGRSRNIPEGFDRVSAEQQFVDLLKAMAPDAEAAGLTIAIEPLRFQETNFINTVREGAEIARRTGSDNVGVLADFYHMLNVGEDASAIIDSADKLRHCHIAELDGRTAPGVHGEDFTTYFKALKEIGYTGRISFECRWDDFDAELPVAFQTVKDQINSIK